MPKEVDGGVRWVFPRRETASIGLASYFGAGHVRQPLNDFVEWFDEHPDSLHDTYFTHTFRTPTAGRVFVVGDAAGMCLGLTGEGIRPAMFFGEACGQTIRRILTGQITLETGLDEYAAFANARKPFFHFFSGAQAILTRVPARWIGWYRLCDPRGTAAALDAGPVMGINAILERPNVFNSLPTGCLRINCLSRC